MLWECGGTLTAAALQQQVIQKLWAFIAPKVIGGDSAATPVAAMGLQSMADALQIHRTELEKVGPDWLIQGYLKS